jgi:hypothetical protein
MDFPRDPKRLSSRILARQFVVLACAKRSSIVSSANAGADASGAEPVFVVKALLVGVGIAIVVFLFIVALELAAMAIGIAAPFLDMVSTGSGGLGAWSSGLSESALSLALVAGIIGFALSLRRQWRRRLRSEATRRS